MNIYEKLQQARIKLQAIELKKSGKNKFANYDYFELSDMLPSINLIFSDLKLCSIVSFNNDLATLTIIDAEKPADQIIITSPMREAELKGCHPIQNLGAVETYQRRYLYMSALEVVEHDALDGELKETKTEKSKPTAAPPAQTENKPENRTEGLISEKQRHRLFRLSKDNNELIKDIISHHGYTKTTDIPISKYEKICKEVVDAQVEDDLPYPTPF